MKICLKNLSGKIEVEWDRQRLAELILGQDFYEGLSKVIVEQYLRRADRIINAKDVVKIKYCPADREK